MCAIQLLTLGLAYAACYFVNRKPLPIVLGLASLQTLSTIWSFVDGTMWIPSFVWALLLWWLVTDAAHATKLAAEHPDLYSSKRMRGEHLSHKKGRLSDSESVRQRASGRGSAGTNWWILGGVMAAVLTLGVAAFQASKKSSDAGPSGARVAQEQPTTSPREATEAFRRAWNSHDIHALGRITKQSLREKMKASLQKIGQRYE